MRIAHKSTQPLSLAHRQARLFSLSSILPLFFVAVMGVDLILLAAVLPLQGIGAEDALLSHGHAFFLEPAHLLFPVQAIRMVLPLTSNTWRSSIMVSWRETGYMFCLFLNVFLFYLLALFVLLKRVRLKYILISTFVLGLICIFFPVVTSPDVFSYISYARIGVIYHHNPLTAWPASILNDPVIPYTYWVNQPSAYGPVWAIITCFMQWVSGLASAGSGSLLHMLMALRFTGLLMHLGSTYLIWSMIGYLRPCGPWEERRTRATLAFAWNPLLLFEAGVNAHVDAMLLFFILLALWVMARQKQPSFCAYLVASLLLALASCIKINVVLLIPGLCIYLWKVYYRRIWGVLAVAFVYVSTIVLLYAPFWDQGRILVVLKVNPAAVHNSNSLPEFMYHFYNTLTFYHPVKLPPGGVSPAEHVTHTASILLFLLIYLLLCLAAFRPGRLDSLPKLISWMAVIWLLYCFIGSPWFWPWYLVTFLGLFAIVEALHRESWVSGMFKLPLAVRLLTFSGLTLYCFSTWGALKTSLPGYPAFNIAYFRGLWMWLLPLFALRVPWKQVSTRVRKKLLRQN